MSDSKFLTAALAYAKAGWCVFPLPEGGKAATLKDWPKLASKDPEQIRKWWTKTPRANIAGIPPGGYFVFDVDAGEGKRGAEVLKDLEAKHDRIPRALVAHTGGGGLHYVLKLPEGAAPPKGLANAYDVKTSSGYIVMAPSVHPNGTPYRWREFEPEEFAEHFADAPEAPQWLVSEGREAEPRPDYEYAVDRLGLTPKEAKTVLRNLDFAEWCDGRDGWVKVGMALHHEFGEDGLDLWDEFSQESAKYDSKDLERVWKSFRGDSDPFRFRSLLKEAGLTMAELRRVPATVSRKLPPTWEILGIDPPPLAIIEKSRRYVGEISTSDTHIGLDFAKRHQADLRYVPEWDHWVEYSGHAWTRCDPIERMQAFASERFIYASKVLNSAVDDSAREFAEVQVDMARKLLARAKQKSSLDSASSLSVIRTAAGEFDADPYVLGVRNGVVDLRTGERIPSSPSQWITKQAGCDFDPDAEAPRFMRLLNRVLPNPEVREFYQRAVGYTLFGLPDAEAIFFVHGTGANGKSVCSNVVYAAMGGYATTVSKAFLVRTPHATEADRDVYAARGARLISINETAKGDVFDDEKLKRTTSRERVRARKLHSEVFDYMPTHTTWIRGNHLPGVRDAGDGFWRRILPIHFGVVIPEHEREENLDRIIIANELPGVLAWAIRGAVDYWRMGLKPPACILEDREAYRRDTDLMGQWWETCTREDPQKSTPIAALYESYCRFMAAAGMGAGDVRQFGAEVAKRPGARLGKSGSVRLMRGRSLTPDESMEFADA